MDDIDDDLRGFPGVREPDTDERGLPCALASLLINYWDGKFGCVATWAENAGHRLWLPIAWDDYVGIFGIRERLGAIAAASAVALDACPTGPLDGEWVGFGEAFGDAMRERFCPLLAPVAVDRDRSLLYTGEYGWRSEWAPLVAGADAKRQSSLALLSRHAWLGRLHEWNAHWDPDMDWREADRLACDLGLPDGRDAYMRAAARELAVAFE